MMEPMGCYNRATENVGAPPAAEAYCRVLAMEVERLAREDERRKIANQICGECSMETPIDDLGVHRRLDTRGKPISFDCDALEVFARKR